MTMPAVQSGDRKSALVWDFMRLGFARRIASLGAFGVIYSTLMVLGLFLRESSPQLTDSLSESRDSGNSRSGTL